MTDRQLLVERLAAGGFEFETGIEPGATFVRWRLTDGPAAGAWYRAVFAGDGRLVDAEVER